MSVKNWFISALLLICFTNYERGMLVFKPSPFKGGVLNDCQET